ncbi:hypothetical protein GCM10020258_18180 [Sphingomonas yabuuchiae]
MFAVYTYLAATLTEVTGASTAMIPLVLAVFGLGMTIGNIVVPRFADRALMPTAGACCSGRRRCWRSIRWRRAACGRSCPSSLRSGWAEHWAPCSRRG